MKRSTPTKVVGAFFGPDGINRLEGRIQLILP